MPWSAACAEYSIYFLLLISYFLFIFILPLYFPHYLWYNIMIQNRNQKGSLSYICVVLSDSPA